MRICILTSFEDLARRDTGYSVRIHNIAAQLAMLGNDVHVVLPKSRDMEAQVNGYTIHGYRGVCPISILRAMGKFIGALKYTALYFYDFGFISKAVRIVSECDVVQLEQQFAGGLFIPLVKSVLRKPFVVDCHDVFQALRIGHASGIRKKLETLLEFLAYKHADLVLTVSERERRILESSRIAKKNVVVVPNGVNLEIFSKSIDKTQIRRKYHLEDSRIVIFVGNMEYYPNREAVEIISTKIAPLVQKTTKNVKFLIVGRTFGNKKPKNLAFLGAVENVSEILAVSDVAIAPLYHGSGTRLKILEYFSSGLPVVATSVAVEGLNVTNGENVLVEDNMDKFASMVSLALNDHMLSSRLSKEAKDFVTRRYRWERIVRHLDTNYRRLISHRPPIKSVFGAS